MQIVTINLMFLFEQNIYLETKSDRILLKFKDNSSKIKKNTLFLNYVNSYSHECLKNFLLAKCRQHQKILKKFT